jgi:hypothetical protein
VRSDASSSVARDEKGLNDAWCPNRAMHDLHNGGRDQRGLGDRHHLATQVVEDDGAAGARRAVRRLTPDRLRPASPTMPHAVTGALSCCRSCDVARPMPSARCAVRSRVFRCRTHRRSERACASRARVSSRWRATRAWTAASNTLGLCSYCGPRHASPRWCRLPGGTRPPRCTPASAPPGHPVALGDAPSSRTHATAKPPCADRPGQHS